ncbi:MAG: PhoH family protein [Desulfosudaceae bacterium]
MPRQAEETSLQIDFPDPEMALRLFGEHGAHLKAIAEDLDITINARGNAAFIKGDRIATDLAKNILNQLYTLLESGYPLYESDINHAVRALREDDRTDLKTLFLETVYVTPQNRPITPRSAAQKRYIDAIRSHDMVFGIGPAGTGKTYLAMAMAVATFKQGLVNRIILTRPAVEAGEALGFLPGDLAEKVDPYLRPLYDALYEMMNFKKIAALMEKKVIEVAPLAFMRGRTLNDSFVILDEAQNTTSQQMKMFLTRIGFNSKAVITGDITQTDLPGGKSSGLIEAKNILNNIEGLDFVYFSKKDVVRHSLVEKIIAAYETSDLDNGSSPDQTPGPAPGPSSRTQPPDRNT